MPNTKQGLTIIETLLVVGLIGVIVYATVPMGLSFYYVQTLDEDVRIIETALSRAQFLSAHQFNDDPHGVKFLNDKAVLFRGASYASRITSDDELFLYGGKITTSGIDEIVFSKATATPVAAASFTVILGSHQQTITVNDQGLVFAP